jgi:hypothetical protein
MIPRVTIPIINDYWIPNLALIWLVTSVLKVGLM